MLGNGPQIVLPSRSCQTYCSWSSWLTPCWEKFVWVWMRGSPRTAKRHASRWLPAGKKVCYIKKNGQKEWGKADRIPGSVIPVQKRGTCSGTVLRRPSSQEVLSPAILTSSSLTVARHPWDASQCGSFHCWKGVKSRQLQRRTTAKVEGTMLIISNWAPGAHGHWSGSSSRGENAEETG